MNRNENTPRSALDAIAQEGRIAKESRMMDERTEHLSPSQILDIRKRALAYMAERQMSVAAMAEELGYKAPSLSPHLQTDPDRITGSRPDIVWAIRLNNHLETQAKLSRIVVDRAFVETSVAREIIQVAEIVVRALGIGVVYGPARIGKTFTLQHLVGDSRLRSPYYVRVTESATTAASFSRAVCNACGDTVSGKRMYDADLFLSAKLRGPKNLLIIDEAERLSREAREWLRDLHDTLRCPLLLAGKPAIIERVGVRSMGDYSELTDQFTGRITIHRDLTERTRSADMPDGSPTAKPAPLFSGDDIRKLIQASNLRLRVDRDAVDWLQSRACMLGGGGVGRVCTLLFLVDEYAVAAGLASISAAALAKVEELTVGGETASRAQLVADETRARNYRVRKLA